MRTNVKPKTPPVATHEGGRAVVINAEQELRRAVMSSLLFENTFYEGGGELAKRIALLIPQVKAESVAQMAIKARKEMHLRHTPLYMAVVMAQYESHKPFVEQVLKEIIDRPDELTELLSLYWAGKRRPIAASVKRGLAAAFKKFTAYSLAKYNRDTPIKLRDVLFLTHPKAKDAAQDEIWKRLTEGYCEICWKHLDKHEGEEHKAVTAKLPTPDTWEVEISASTDKLVSWTRLLNQNKLGPMALMRNLRNMAAAGVDENTIRAALLTMVPERVLPFRFIAAARYAPQFERELEAGMFKCLEGVEKLSGHTTLLVDVSGSMSDTLSGKSEMSRLDAAAGLAMLLAEVCPNLSVYTFATSLNRVANRRGFALRDAIGRPGGGTYLASALDAMPAADKAGRLIIISDEQAHDTVFPPNAQTYMVNVASYANGVSYGKGWVHIDGWSEAIVAYIAMYEKELTQVEK